MNIKTKSLKNVLLSKLPLAWLIGCLCVAGIVWARGQPAPRPQIPKYITRNIEDVRVGDYVLAKDPGQAGPPTPHRVIALPRNWTEHIVHMTVEGGGELQATRNHPFYVDRKGWTEARDLHLGDKLRDADGRAVGIERLWTEDRQADTFNLTVEGVHTYYVLAGGTPVLVHNTGPDPSWLQQQSWDQDLEEGATDEDLSFWGGGGVIYEVPGTGTASGKPYIGRSADWGNRQQYTGDGRDRPQGEVVGRYPENEEAIGKQMEQQAMDDRGGLSNLDNKRNEIARPPCD
ncbi:MAG TPA: polymorphic toxin-type HINT domain-containing protein [Tepidisphaeraceae bacterium]|nr:polymorphic toxin-type HINT domain-containing protein [Tepidisphaeraceae bacterium]